MLHHVSMETDRSTRGGMHCSRCLLQKKSKQILMWGKNISITILISCYSKILQDLQKLVV